MIHDWEIIRSFRQTRAKWIDRFIRKRQFLRTDFCLISNNCWGAMHFYQRFGLKYNTPTVGLYISDTDFVKFCNNLQLYLSQQLIFISPAQCPAYDEVCRWGLINPNNNDHFNFPVGMIGDVTIWFMHYKSEEEAREKWIRRSSRVNLEKIIVKWSQRYTDNNEIVSKFLEIPYPKFGIVDKECPVDSDDLVKLSGWSSLKDEGGDEISFTGKYLDTISIINNTLKRYDR